MLSEFAKRACILTGCKSYSSRVKAPSSIIRKMSQNRAVDDLLGVRLVHPRPKEACKKLEEGIPGAVLKKDYITFPKRATGYQALHMSVPMGRYEVEVQIQTEEMYERALQDGYHLELPGHVHDDDHQDDDHHHHHDHPHAPE